MTNDDKDPDADTGDAAFNPPGPVARDRVISSHDDEDFEKPGSVTRDQIHDHQVKRGIHDDRNKERGV